MKLANALALATLTFAMTQVSFGAENDAAHDSMIEDLGSDGEVFGDYAQEQHKDELKRNHEQALNKNRARLRQELQRAAASDKQVEAKQKLDKVDPALAELRLKNAKRTYTERGRNELLTSGDASVDAKVISQWAREQRLRNDEESNRRMQEELRKRYPATSAAQSLNGWSEGDDIGDQRAEARKLLKERSEQMKKIED